MMSEEETEATVEREALEQQRASLLRELPQVFEAIARKGAVVTTLARSALGAGDAPSRPLRAAAFGAFAGGAAMAVGVWMLRRYEARQRLDRQLGRALLRLIDAQRPSMLRSVAATAAGAAFELAAALARDALLQGAAAAPRPTPVIPPLPPRAVAARPSTVVSAAAPLAPPPFAPAARVET